MRAMLPHKMEEIDDLGPRINDIDTLAYDIKALGLQQVFPSHRRDGQPRTAPMLHFKRKSTVLPTHEVRVDQFDTGYRARFNSVHNHQEYQKTAEKLTLRYGDLNASAVLRQIIEMATFVEAAPFVTPVCGDSDDDIFLEAALSSGASVITTGDKLLLDCDGFQGIKVMKPRAFLGMLSERD